MNDYIHTYKKLVWLFTKVDIHAVIITLINNMHAACIMMAYVLSYLIFVLIVKAVCVCVCVCLLFNR